MTRTWRRGRRPLSGSWILGVVLAFWVASIAGAQTPSNLPTEGTRAIKDHRPPTSEDEGNRHVIAVSGPQEMKDFFHYTPDRIPFVSAHRGGPGPGFPENCIATFDQTIRHTWAIMEIDPHYSKDGAIVLMHDPTLERTSTGHGKVSDLSLAELQELHLKDPMGNVTNHRIPTLEQALEWARGKTILILDQKDVPAQARAQAIKDHHAQSYAMVMCYSFEDARICHEVDKDIMMEVFLPTRASVEKFDRTGVPWSNVVAFVSHGQPKEPEIFRLIHEKGAMGIMGSSRNLDRAYVEGKIGKTERDDGYRQLIQSGADIIEADLGAATGEALEPLRKTGSSKQKYFLIEPQAGLAR